MLHSTRQILHTHTLVFTASSSSSSLEESADLVHQKRPPAPDLIAQTGTSVLSAMWWGLVQPCLSPRQRHGPLDEADPPVLAQALRPAETLHK